MKVEHITDVHLISITMFENEKNLLENHFKVKQRTDFRETRPEKHTQKSSMIFLSLSSKFVLVSCGDQKRPRSRDCVWCNRWHWVREKTKDHARNPQSFPIFSPSCNLHDRIKLILVPKRQLNGALSVVISAQWAGFLTGTRTRYRTVWFSDCVHVQSTLLTKSKF